MKTLFKRGIFVASAILMVLFMGCSNDSNDSNDSSDDIVTDFPSGTTVWEGSIDLGDWDLRWPMEATHFSTFEAGDQIQITHEASPTYSDYTELDISPYGIDWGENRLINGSGINCSPSDKGLNPFTKKQTTAYTFTADDIAKIKDFGLVIWGSGLKITKVTFACKTAPKLNLFGYVYETSYTVTRTDTTNGVTLTNEPLYIQMTDYGDNSNEGLMGFRINRDITIDGTAESWLGVSGIIEFSPTERTGTMIIYERKNNIHILQSATSSSYTVPDDFSEGEEFTVSYTADYKTLSLTNTSSGNKYDFTICKYLNWMEK